MKATVDDGTHARTHNGSFSPRLDGTNADNLRREARRAGAELQLRDGRAWVIVVGTVTTTRALAVAALVDELGREHWLQRLSLDLTCTIVVERCAAMILDTVRAGAPAWMDVTGAGAVGRLHVGRHAA